MQWDPPVLCDVGTMGHMIDQIGINDTGMPHFKETTLKTQTHKIINDKMLLNSGISPPAHTHPVLARGCLPFSVRQKAEAG